MSCSRYYHFKITFGAKITGAGGGGCVIALTQKDDDLSEFVNVIEENNIVGQIKPFHAGETLNWEVEGIIN